jgi:hypothetical protein
LKGRIRGGPKLLRAASTGHDKSRIGHRFSTGIATPQSNSQKLPYQGQRFRHEYRFRLPTVNALTEELLLLQKGEASHATLIEEQMQAVIEKYGTFPAHVPRENNSGGRYLVSLSRASSCGMIALGMANTFQVVTGATGSLGAHVIAQLAVLPDVKLVHCFVRAKSLASA